MVNNRRNPERSKRRKRQKIRKCSGGNGPRQPEKGRGPRRGGERDPRVRSGPGGGGRRRPYRKLIRKRPWGRPQVSHRPPAAYHHTCPHAASANRITTYAARPEKGLCRSRHRLVRIFQLVSLCKNPSLRQLRRPEHCPLTSLVSALTRPTWPNSQSATRREGAAEPAANGM
jgi:hypothetical protein